MINYNPRPISPSFIGSTSTPLVSSNVGPVLTGGSFISGGGFGGYPVGYGGTYGAGYGVSTPVVTTPTIGPVAPQMLTSGFARPISPVLGATAISPMVGGAPGIRPVSPMMAGSTLPYGGASYLNRPVSPIGLGTSVIGQTTVPTPPAQKRVQMVPYSKRVIDYETRQWLETIPRQRVITQYQENRWVQSVPREVVTTEYLPIEHQTHYIPNVTKEVITETTPVQRVIHRTEYIPVETQQYQQLRAVAYYPQDIGGVTGGVYGGGVYRGGAIGGGVIGGGVVTGGMAASPLYGSAVVTTPIAASPVVANQILTPMSGMAQTGVPMTTTTTTINHYANNPMNPMVGMQNYMGQIPGQISGYGGYPI